MVARTVLIEELFARFRPASFERRAKSNVCQEINIGKICCYCGTRTERRRAEWKKGERERERERNGEEEIGAEWWRARRLSQGREQTHYLL